MAKLRTTRVFIVALVAISIFIIIGYFFIQQKERALVADAIDAIPINASYIFEINNIIKFNQEFRSENEIWQQLLEFNQLSEFNKQIKRLDTIVAKSENLQKLLKKKKVLISSHTIGTNEIVFLFTIKLENKKENKIIITEFSKLSASTDTIENSRDYSQTKLYTIVGNSSNYYYSIIDNILVLSKSEHLIENAIRQKMGDTPIRVDLGFKNIATLLEKNTNHFFVNYSNFGQVYSNFFSTVFSNKIKKLDKFANWAALDIDYAKNTISFSGYSFAESSPDMYLHIFENIKPQKFDLANVLPTKTAQFTYFGFNNVAKFYSNYEKYINSKNLLGTHKTEIDKFNTDFDVDIQTDVLQLIDNSISFVDVNFNNSVKDLAHFTIIKITKKKDFEDFLNKMTNYYKTENNIDDNFSKAFNIDNSITHTIYKLPVNNFVKILFGEIYNIEDQSYYFFYNDFVFFCSSADNAKQLINTIYRKNTLDYNDEFKQFIKNIPPKSNILYYTNSYFNSYAQLSSLKQDNEDIYKKNSNFFSKIQHVSVQFTYEKKNLFQTNINIFYNKDLSSNGLSAWEIELSNNVTTKPFFFMNHNSYEKEIFVQDKSNLIYLLDKNGSVIWKKKLTEQIIGEIHLVDLYNNSKYQLMFATSNYIFAIDRNGNPVENFPVKLNKTTKIGISIIDYESNNDYRIFVPCTDNILYLYDNKGKEVEGWIKPKTASSITSQIEYFSFNDKDYLVYSDKTKPYILNRKGENRVIANTNFPMADNSSYYFQEQVNNTKAKFITTDASGKIVAISLNGEVETKKLITVSKNHTFIAYDVNNDELLDYIITDDKTVFVYNFDGEKIFSYTFKNKIGNKPIMLKFSEDDVKIGIVLPAENNVYVLNSDGTIANNFPVKGNSIFSVGILNADNNFNLIVGNNNFLCNYLLF